MLYIIGIVAFILLVFYIDYLKKRRIKRIVEAEWREKRILSLKEDIESVESCWKFNSKESNYIGVDSITWRDLSMDDVYHKINYTQTSIGSEYLYDQLHKINLTNQDHNESFYELMQKNKELRTRLIFELKRLGKRNYSNSSSYFQENYTNIKNIWFYISCGILPVVSIFLTIFFMKIGIAIFITSIILNIIIYYKSSTRVDINIYEISYIARIIWTGKRLAKIKDDEFQPYAKEICDSVQPIRKILLLERILSLGKGTGDFEGLFEYIRIIFLLDYISYYFMIRMIHKHKDKYEKLWKIIGEIDVGIAVAFYRHSIVDYCTPTFIDREEINFKEMFHPLIKDPVKNSSHLLKLTLITGSNASGKSTYMKAVAINAILAQTINTVLASGWSMKPSVVLSSMAIQDNVIEGDSYFRAEIKSLKRIIQTIESGIPCLSFIDEILRGTNTVERIAASASIMVWLTKHHGMTMIASHDIELTTMIGGFNNYHFHETVYENNIYFDYKIHPGPSTTKNAIKLLEQMDYPFSVTELAYSLANRFEEKSEWNYQPKTNNDSIQECLVDGS
ncbi:MutS-related protein [Neobacillus niacini]|uniref:MutS-related protein n=1 Tax=Neobacillus niacini TaxID=86668 RepID=UPI0028634C9F|nr:hypothetical protein [Neobacillus niacini]MDR7002736.1 energy-coupling factor transporter ATP-binding protein EcfA2 [Neobacillus niacini]